MPKSTKRSRKPEAQQMKTTSSAPGSSYLHSFSHHLLTTTKGDVRWSGSHRMETSKSGVEDSRPLAPPSAAVMNIDVEAQVGTMSVPGKLFHHFPCPPFRWSQSHTLIFLQMLGEGRNSQASSISPSGHVEHEDTLPANQAISGHANHSVLPFSITGVLDDLMQ
jgi:hypothetical protein